MTQIEAVQKPFLLMRRAELVDLLRDQFGVTPDGLLGRTVQELRKMHADLLAEGAVPGAPRAATPPKRITTAAGKPGTRLEYAKRVLRRVGLRA